MIREYFSWIRSYACLVEYVIWPSISCSSKMGYASLSEWDPRNSFKLYHGFQITIIGIWFYQRIQICFPIGKWLNGLLCLSFYFGTFKVCVLEIRITCKMRNPIVGFNSCSSWTNDSFFSICSQPLNCFFL